MAKFSFDIGKDENGFKLDQMKAEMPDGSVVELERKENGGFKATWEGENETVQSVLNFLHNRFPGLNF